MEIGSCPINYILANMPLEIFSFLRPLCSSVRRPRRRARYLCCSLGYTETNKQIRAGPAALSTLCYYQATAKCRVNCEFLHTTRHSAVSFVLSFPRGTERGGPDGFARNFVSIVGALCGPRHPHDESCAWFLLSPPYFGWDCF